MPRVLQRAERTLQACCISNICQNMDNVWCKNFIQFYYKQGHWRYILGPFDHLPVHITQAIFKYLRENKLLRRHHIYLLISIYCKEADFSTCCDSDLGLMLQLTMERCYKLESLNLSRCSKIPKAIFGNLISAIPTLTSIDVSSSNIGDEQLSVVGVYCRNIRHLHLSHTSVSDKGLQCLVLPQDLNQVHDERYGQCLGLVVVKVAGCQLVSERGVVSLLTHLPLLTVLDYQNSVGAVVQAVSQLRDSRRRQGDPNNSINPNSTISLRLKSLSMCFGSGGDALPDDEGDDPLCVAVSSCPQLQFLHILPHPELSEVSLFSLLEIKELRELHIRNETEQQILLPFCSTVEPLLSAHSQTLTSIHLSQVEDVSIAGLRNGFPNLAHLDLHWNSYTAQQPPNSGRNSQNENSNNLLIFPRLLTAKVFAVEYSAGGEESFSDVSEADLLSILAAPELQTLALTQCHHLTDSLLTAAYQLSQLEQLTSLDLVKCDHVTFDSLALVLETENRLESVKLLQCNEVTRKDFQKYEKLVNKKKWNIKLEWS